jgi:hypothetical protein
VTNIVLLLVYLEITRLHFKQTKIIIFLKSYLYVNVHIALTRSEKDNLRNRDNARIFN